MPEEIVFYVDGQEVTTSSDQMVLQAASDAGIYIPYLCYHPGMKPYGACRMCVVEVEGMQGTPAACTLPIRPGMKVNTKANSPLAIRDSIMDLLLSEHPHGCLTCHRIDLCGPQDICLRHVNVTDRCVTCPKNERCELKDTVRFHSRELNSPLTYQYRGLQVETKDPFYHRDYNLCIVCARCTRACDEIRGDLAIAMTERSGQVLVGTSQGDSLLESGCEFCGACIDACPVGALTEADYKWERPARIEQSVCNNCPVGCRINYEVNHLEKVVRAIPELNAPANHGQACFKGKFGFKYVNHADRLEMPLITHAGHQIEASWEDAISLVADNLQNFSGEEFALLISPRATNEEMYAAQKFARVVMKSNNVNSPSNDRPGIAEGLLDVFGYASGTGSMDDLTQASIVLIVSANVTEEQNVMAIPIKQAVRQGSQKLIVIDSRETELTRHAQLWLRPYPGTDLTLIGGFLKVIFDEELQDLEFLQKRCVDVTDLKASLAPFNIDAVSDVTGVTQDQIRAGARLFAMSGPASILFGLDNVPASTHLATTNSIINLALITGNVGKPGAALFPLRTGANDQGALDMGCDPNLLPGHLRISDAAAREKFSNAWNVTLPEKPGLSLDQIVGDIRLDKIKAMLIIGDHSSYHDGSFADVHGALDQLEFLMVSDNFSSELSERAQVVLPSSTFLEKCGTYTNFERRIQPLNQVIEPDIQKVRSDLHILTSIAMEMGIDGFAFKNQESVLDEISKLVPAYSGVTYQRLQDEAQRTMKPDSSNPLPTQLQYSDYVPMGLQWPCPSKKSNGTAILHSITDTEKKFALPDIPWMIIPRHDDVDLPLLLIPGRLLAQSGQPIEIIQADGKNMIQRGEFLMINPEIALKAGFREGQEAQILDGLGTAVAKGTIRLSDQAHYGTVTQTTLFGELATFLDNSELYDPMNRVPKLRVVPVKLEAL